MSDNSQVSAKIKNNNEINLLSLSVVRRDGSIAQFKSEKIFNAIKKAFLAQTKIRNNKEKDNEQTSGIHKTIEILTDKVVTALTRRIADGDMIHIEDIQDQVELALMRDEHHKVARAYVLYREQRAASRYHTKKLKEQVGVKVSSMMVTKRDGTKEPVSLDKITNRVSVLSTGLSIDPIVVAQKAIPGLYNDITSTEIDNYLAETSAALTVEHPDYSNLAARIKSNALHKLTPGFVIATKNLFEDGLLHENYYNKVMQNVEEIESKTIESNIKNDKPGLILPDYTRVDFAAYYDIADDLSVKLNVENLTDELYFPHSHSTHQASVGEPLNARISLRKRF